METDVVGGVQTIKQPLAGTTALLSKFEFTSSRFVNNLDQTELIFTIAFSALDQWKLEQHALLTFPSYYANHIGLSLLCQVWKVDTEATAPYEWETVYC